VPKAIREALGAEPGDDVLFVRRGDEVVLQRRARTLIIDFAGAAAATAPSGGLDRAALTDAIEDALGQAYHVDPPTGSG
jgi:bifunctional DNA-binding transcriptional regulator/antitoxin component of YhaV-PrlF toxin-antitoxin module